MPVIVKHKCGEVLLVSKTRKLNVPSLLHAVHRTDNTTCMGCGQKLGWKTRLTVLDNFVGRTGGLSTEVQTLYCVVVED